MLRSQEYLICRGMIKMIQQHAVHHVTLGRGPEPRIGNTFVDSAPLPMRWHKNCSRLHVLHGLDILANLRSFVKI